MPTMEMLFGPTPVPEAKPLMCVTCGSRVGPKDMYLHEVHHGLWCVGPIFMRMEGEPKRGDWNLEDFRYGLRDTKSEEDEDDV